MGGMGGGVYVGCVGVRLRCGECHGFPSFFIFQSKFGKCRKVPS